MEPYNRVMMENPQGRILVLAVLLSDRMLTASDGSWCPFPIFFPSWTWLWQSSADDIMGLQPPVVAIEVEAESHGSSRCLCRLRTMSNPVQPWKASVFRKACMGFRMPCTKKKTGTRAGILLLTKCYFINIFTFILFHCKMVF